MKLGRYEVVRELGKGAMGVVYLAKDPLIGRLVALKTIRAAAYAEDDETKEFQQRFIREAQAAGILNHPAIVTVHDIGQDDESAMSFIAMEYVEGQNLKEVMNQGRNLTFDQIGDIAAQVADALDFAHSKGIVHRDVKPANIILVEGQRAKITDFGIAKIASSAANLTTTGQFLGTPNYMAPEQIKGAPVDGRTDIFALGICIYEALTRRKPFGGDSLTSISYKIVHEPFAPLREINPQIPEGYEEIVANCLAKDPAKRYQRARDLANALRAVVRGERPPRPADPLLHEETMVTRDKAPTMEVPYPQTAQPPAADLSAGTKAAASAAAAAAAMPAETVQVQIPAAALAAAKEAAAAAAVPAAPAEPLGRQVRRTLTNVRAMPLWRRRVPTVLFILIVALLVGALVATILVMRSWQVAIPQVDTVAEARHARETKLRREGEELLRQGKIADAYTRYAELQRMRPGSPFVIAMMERLNAIRQQEENNRQQLVLAQQKFDEGVALFNAKDYVKAIERFQESFTLNPNAAQTAEYLKQAQLEFQKASAAKPSKKAATKPAVPTTTRAETTATVAETPSEPVKLATVFTHPFTDGRIIVRVGGDVVTNERLYDEKPARLFRRASRAPRPVSTTGEFPAKSADVQVWITVPALGIQETHTLPAVRFASGSEHRLTIRYDQAGKKFSYELN